MGTSSDAAEKVYCWAVAPQYQLIDQAASPLPFLKQTLSPNQSRKFMAPVGRHHLQSIVLVEAEPVLEEPPGTVDVVSAGFDSELAFLVVCEK